MEEGKKLKPIEIHVSFHLYALHEKPLSHVTTLLATSKSALFPGHNH